MKGKDTSPAGEAWRAMHELFFNEFIRGRMVRVAASLGMTPGLMKTLFMLEAEKGVPLRDLAGLWQCDPSYVTSLADDLEARGLAERVPHPTDRRVKMLVISAAGLAAKESAFALLHQPPPAFAALTETEQRRLRDLLLKLVAGQAAAAS